jgi:hypothetical protein
VESSAAGTTPGAIVCSWFLPMDVWRRWACLNLTLVLLLVLLLLLNMLMMIP